MILRIELPATNMAIEGGLVAEWHKKAGDVIGHGDDLVDIVVEEVTRLQRKPPKKLFGSTKTGKAKYFTRKGAGFRIRVTALDSGTLTGIDSPEGTWVTEGSHLATMRPQADSSTGSEPNDVDALARVVVNRIEATSEPADR